MIRTVISYLRPAVLLVSGMLLTACGGSESSTAVVSTENPTIFYAHTVAFRNNTAVAWGYNGNGQLGTGDGTSATTPVLVNSGSVTGMNGVAVGGTHSVVFDNISGGAVKAWGNNARGQVGDGTTDIKTTPVVVKREDGASLTGLQAVAAGAAHNLALRRDGTVWAWGYNGYGQLGINNTADKASAVPVGLPEVTGLPAGITAIAAGGSHSLALDSLGRVWGWGYNGYGQLGDGTSTDKFSPVSVVFPEPVTVIAIAAGGSTSIAIDSTGQVWGWGYNKYGQTGQTPGAGVDGVKQAVPMKITSLTSVSKIAVGLDHCLALKLDGTLWAWGYNGYGQLGDGETVPAVSDEAVYEDPALVVTGTEGIQGSITEIRAIGHHSLAVTSDGKVWAWGYNVYNQLGDGTTTNRSKPRVVSGF